MTSSIQGECKEQLFVGILQFNIWELELGLLIFFEHLKIDEFLKIQLFG